MPPPTEPLSKEEALKEIVSLSSADDERKAVSKKISWILRGGAQSVGISKDSEGYVKFRDIVHSVLFKKSGLSEAKLWEIVEQSNEQKQRYTWKRKGNSTLIKALERTDRKQFQAQEKRPVRPVGPVTDPAQDQLRQSIAAQQAYQGAGMAAAQQAYQGAGMAIHPHGYGGDGYGAQYGGLQNVATLQAMQAVAEARVRQQIAETRFHGVVSDFKADKGYGFISSPESYQYYGSDIFFRQAECGAFNSGTQVTFFVDLNQQGQPRARDMQLLHPQGRAQGKQGQKGEAKGNNASGKGKGKSKGGEKGDGMGGYKGDGKGGYKGGANANDKGNRKKGSGKGGGNATESIDKPKAPSKAKAKKAAAVEDYDYGAS